MIAALLAAALATPGTAIAATARSLRLRAQHQVPGTTDVDIDNGTPERSTSATSGPKPTYYEATRRPTGGTSRALLHDPHRRPGQRTLEQCIGAADVPGGSLMFHSLLRGPRRTLAIIGGRPLPPRERDPTLRTLDEHTSAGSSHSRARALPHASRGPENRGPRGRRATVELSL